MPSLKFFLFLSSLSFLFFFNLILANGETTNIIDSLFQIVEKEKDDTNKVKTLLQISQEYSKTDPGKALEYSNRAFILASNQKYKGGEIDAIIQKSRVFVIMSQLDSAIFYSQNAIKMSEDLHDEKRMADGCIVQAGNIIRKEGPSAAREYYFKAHHLYKKIGDSTGYMNSLNGLGIVYYRQAEYDSAIYYYFEYIKLCEKFKYEEGLGKGYVNLAIVYYDLKDFNNAEYYFKESINVNEKYNNPRFLSIAYNNLGSIAYYKNDLEKALYFYSLSQELNVKVNNVFGLAQAKSNIGNIYESRNDYKVALDYYTEAKDLLESIKNIDGFIAAYNNIGLIHERRKNYAGALTIYDSCLVLAKTSNLLKREEEILFNLHRTYKVSGDFKKAYQIQTEWVTLKDSIFNIEKDKQIKNLQVKYDKEKDQARILSLENENLAKNLDLRKQTNQRNGYMYSGIGLVLIISFVFIFYRHNTIKDKIIADQKIKQLEEEKKLLAAKAIVEGQEEERKRIAKDLHDGLGVLLSAAKMQFSTIKDKSPANTLLIKKATKLLEQASGDVRKISHNMMPGLLTKFGFFEAVEELFDQINDTKELNANIKIDGETFRLPENLEIMLYRMIQEMVNNTMKHAEARNISLILRLVPNKLNIQYSDNGKGFNVEEKLKIKSMGLTGIQSRVSFLNGNMSLESSAGNGVAYYIEIPLTGT